jgi:hypothetical protein
MRSERVSELIFIYFQSAILEFLNENGGPRKIVVAKKVKNSKKEIEANERHDERPALINFVARLGSSMLVRATFLFRGLSLISSHRKSPARYKNCLLCFFLKMFNNRTDFGNHLVEDFFY